MTYPCLDCGETYLGPDHCCEPREAGRQPHSKPRVCRWADSDEYRAVLLCCPVTTPGLLAAYPTIRYDTWCEAMDAAHAHVREHHEPKAWDLDESPGDPDEELAAITCWCGRLCCRHHRDDPEPAVETWRDLLTTSREDC